MLTKFEIGPRDALMKSQEMLSKAIWIDLLAPSAEERDMVEQEIKIELPLHHEMYQIEFSNRFYVENDAIFLSVNVVTKASPVPEGHVVTFILTEKQLITLRYSDPNPIQTFAETIEHRKCYVQDNFDIFLLILRKIVGSVADIFELIGEKTDELAMSLVGSTEKLAASEHNKRLNKILRSINFLQSLLGKGYQCLQSLGLLIAFIKDVEHQSFAETDLKRFQTLNQDITTLSRHGEHLTQKLNFQLQSTLGLINIEQTQIIKIFTVLAMIFMPPTLIASIYGMNFHHMPELDYIYGYPIAILAMLATAFLPYLFFKRKKWI